MNCKKLFKRFLQGSLQNVSFSDFRSLVEAFGFRLHRTSGSHHIYSRAGLPELINLRMEDDS